MVATRTMPIFPSQSETTTGIDGTRMTAIDGIGMTTAIKTDVGTTMTIAGAVMTEIGMTIAIKIDVETTTTVTRIDAVTTVMTMIATRIGVEMTTTATRIDVEMMTTTATRTGGGSKTTTATRIDDVETIRDATIAMKTTETKVVAGETRRRRRSQNQHRSTSSVALVAILLLLCQRHLPHSRADGAPLNRLRHKHLVGATSQQLHRHNRFSPTAAATCLAEQASNPHLLQSRRNRWEASNLQFHSRWPTIRWQAYSLRRPTIPSTVSRELRSRECKATCRVRWPVVCRLQLQSQRQLHRRQRQPIHCKEPSWAT
mmetsp:Transcript_46799/g.72964  ORF Transcript_46799/g.72964 Transcript_46799/m.72964 type:complete len:315 (-) Transcript_46799:411-1355(-)